MSHCLQCGDYTRNGPYCVACEFTQEAEPSDETVCVGCDQPFNESGWCEACEEWSPAKPELLPENLAKWVA